MFSLANLIVFCKYKQILNLIAHFKKLGKRQNKSQKMIEYSS